MTATSTVNDLLLTARIVRRHMHDREVEISALRDEIESGGIDADVDEGLLDAFAEATDDLALLVEQIEKTMFDTPAPEAHCQGSTTAIATVSDGLAPLMPAGWCDRPDPSDDDDRASDDAVPASDDDWDDVADFPTHAMASIQPAFAAFWKHPECRLPLPALTVRIPRDGDEYRAILDPKPGQLTANVGCEGDRMTTLHAIMLIVLDSELVDESPVFLCLDIRDDDDSDNAYVVSGWATHIDAAQPQPAIEFTDGTSVPVSDIMAIKFGQAGSLTTIEHT